MVADRARGFGDEAAVPVIGMQSVPDLDLPRHFSMMVKSTIPDHRVLIFSNHGKLRRNTGAIPLHYFLDKSNGLFAFGENA